MPISHTVLVALALAGPPDAEAVLERTGFDASARDAVRAGHVEWAALDPAQDAELAVAVAAVVAAAPEAVWQALVSGAARDRDPALIESVDVDAIADGWRIALGEAELDALLDDDAAFNLSVAERNRVRGVKRLEPERRRERVATVYTECVVGRARAYGRRGLASVLPYQHDGDERVDVQTLLRRAQAAEPMLRALAPALAGPATGIDTPGVDRAVSIMLRTVEERPCAIVAERLATRGPGVDAMLERHVYAGHSYDAMQLVTLCLPDGPDRTVVLLLSRTSVGRVDAFGRGVRRRVGRGRVADELTEHLRRLRAAAAD